MKTIQVSLCISRASDNNVYLRINDNRSRCEFIEVKIDLESFASIITGLSGVDAVAEVRGLENIGKERIIEQRSVNCPISGYSKKDAVKTWLLDNCKEEGWQINTYLGSKNSIVSTDFGCIVNYSVTRYEDVV